jgi:hypothetical protein
LFLSLEVTLLAVTLGSTSVIRSAERNLHVLRDARVDDVSLKVLGPQSG